MRGVRGQNRATLEELRAMKAIDARNAGWRCGERGDTGEEPRYLRWRTANPEAFAEGLASWHEEHAAA